MTLLNKLKQLTEYKTWANQLTFGAVMKLPESEATKQRSTRFGNMVHTLNHVYVIDDIFKAHLTGTSHSYKGRNTQSPPPLDLLWQKQQEMDQWYIDYAKELNEDDLNEVVEFQFVGGGEGAMTREDIIIHVVNHGTYHRGFVGDMMYQANAVLPANDYPVFIRDAANNT